MSGQRKKVIGIIVGLLAAVGLFIWRLQPSEKDKQFQENFAKSQQAASSGTTGAGAAPGGATPATGAPQAAGTPAPGGAAGTAGVQSRFQTADVNVAELLKTVREVTFDYDAERAQRDPLRPLVGPMAPAAVRAGPEGSPATPSRQQAEALARSMRLTGIVWDRSHPLAVINDEVVSQGFAFDGGIVVEAIEPHRVILRISEADSPESLIPIELEER